MKNTKLIFILLLISIVFAACNKYEEGPMISLRKVETRVAQDFELVEFTKDGVDMTQELADSCGYEWHFLSEGGAYGYVNNLMVYPTDSLVPNVPSRGEPYMADYYISRDKKEIYIRFWEFYIPYNYYYYTGIEPFIGEGGASWKIERLTIDEMWLSCTYNNSDYYIKFEEDEKQN